MPETFAKVDRARARPGDIFDGDLSTPMPTVEARSRFPVSSELAFVRIGIDDVWVDPTGEERPTETSLKPT